MTTARDHSRGTRTFLPQPPFWYPDVRERFLALLPELLLSIVAVTCMCLVMSYRDGASIAALVVTAGLTQVFVQGTLYVCTYLIDDDRGVNAAWLILPMGLIALEAVFGFTGLAALNDAALTYAGPFSVLLGIGLFYAMRLRGTFVFMIINVLTIAGAVDKVIAANVRMVPVHIVCIAATTALYVMRSSATHVTTGEGEEPSPLVDDEEQAARTLGMYGQIATLAMGVIAFCLMVALAGTPAAWRWATGAGAETEAAAPIEMEVEIGPSAEGAGPEAETGAEAPVGEALTGDEVTGAPADAGGIATPEPSASAAGGLFLTVMLLALLVLPVPVRLLLRKLARFSIKRKPRAADRAARIYVGVISRLAAAGIERDEAHTPYEFLEAHENELAQLTEPAGVGFDEWMVLTDTYEKARYADCDPATTDLETCWRIYDALPFCARTSMGWPRYLASAFWRM